MPRAGSRRPLITDQAISLLASGGARALSHQAIDRAADLPPGSTSYYFRTRRELIAGTVERIRECSRAAFDEAHPPTPSSPADAGEVADFINDQLAELIDARQEQTLAVFALLPEVVASPELRAPLTSCLFSQQLAENMLTGLRSHDPGTAAKDLIDFLIGALWGLLFRSPEDRVDELTRIRHTIRRSLASGDG